mgnify:CR=1 FL=1
MKWILLLSLSLNLYAQQLKEGDVICAFLFEIDEIDMQTYGEPKKEVILNKSHKEDHLYYAPRVTFISQFWGHREVEVKLNEDMKSVKTTFHQMLNENITKYYTSGPHELKLDQTYVLELDQGKKVMANCAPVGSAKLMLSKFDEFSRLAKGQREFIFNSDYQAQIKDSFRNEVKIIEKDEGRNLSGQKNR